MAAKAHAHAVHCTSGELDRVADKIRKLEPYWKSMAEEATGGVCVPPLTVDTLQHASQHIASTGSSLMLQVCSCSGRCCVYPGCDGVLAVTGAVVRTLALIGAVMGAKCMLALMCVVCICFDGCCVCSLCQVAECSKLKLLWTDHPSTATEEQLHW